MMDESSLSANNLFGRNGVPNGADNVTDPSFLPRRASI